MKRFPENRVRYEWRDEFRALHIKQKIYCDSNHDKCFINGAGHRDDDLYDLPQKKRSPGLTNPAKHRGGSASDDRLRLDPLSNPKPVRLDPPARGSSSGSGMKNRYSELKAPFVETWQDFSFPDTVPNFRVTPRVTYAELLNVTVSGSGGKSRRFSPHAYSRTLGVSVSGNRTIRKFNSTGKLMYEYVSDGPQVNGVNGGLPSISSTSISYNKTLGKLFEQLRGGVDLSVTLAEHGQLTGMLNKARKLSSYVAGFNRTSISRRHLEFIYGWKPLAKDLFDSIQQLSNRAGNSLVLKSRSSHVERSSAKDYSGVIFEEINFYVSHRTEMCLHYTPQPSFFETMLRYTSLNPVSIAWERLPYSFVFDWFLDVGGYLRALETSLLMPGAVIQGYVTTTQSQRIEEIYIGSGKPDAQGFQYYGTTRGDNRKNSKSRILVNSLPLPRLPAFNVQLGASRLLSAASLLAVKLGIPKDQAKRMRTLTSQKWDIFAKRSKTVKANPWNDPLYTR